MPRRSKQGAGPSNSVWRRLKKTLTRALKHRPSSKGATASTSTYMGSYPVGQDSTSESSNDYEPLWASVVGGEHVKLNRYRERPLNVITGVIIHRSAVAETGQEMVEAFVTETDKYAPGYYTGGKIPYHYFIRKDGKIDVCLPVQRVALGAGILNYSGIQVALHGDFRKKPPTVAQKESLRRLLYYLSIHVGGPLRVMGHMDRDDTSVHPSKECPGKYLWGRS